MHRRHALVPLAMLALSAAGCGKKQPESTPQPVDSVIPTPTRPTPPPPPAPPGPAGNETAVTTRLAADLGNVIRFDYDQDAIKPEYRPVLDRKADIMRANPNVRIRIAGHADERGSDEYNLVLGNKRALAAKRYLESRGVDANRIEITSFGEERPADPGSNETAWAQNRRAEFEITAGGARLVEPR